MSHGVPIAALEDDHSHVLNAKSALLKKSKGVNKPKVNVNVEGGGRLVIREVINKKETDEDEQVGKSIGCRLSFLGPCRCYRQFC